jgi:hypothetical protein
MPWYSAPARFAAATYRRSSSENRCQPIADEHVLPARPGPGTAERRLARAGCHPETGKAETAASPGADRPPACSMLPPTELAFSGIDLDAVPLPRIEETFRARHLHTAHARTGSSPRPARRTGPPAQLPTTPSAVPRPPGHMPPPTLIRWHIPAQITQICPLRASHANQQGPAPYRVLFARAHRTQDRWPTYAWPLPRCPGRSRTDGHPGH